jgi:TRAP-type uncharacterized transport system fused permease subunit
MKIDRSYGGLVRLAIIIVAVAMALYHMWAIAFGSPEAFYFRGTHLMFAMVLVFLIHRWSGAIEGTPSALDYLLLVLSVTPIVYLFVNYEYFVTRIFYIDGHRERPISTWPPASRCWDRCVSFRR